MNRIIQITLSIFIMLFMTLYEISNNLKNTFNKKNIYPNNDNNLFIKSKKLKIKKINYNEISYDILKKYIDNSIPIIIKNIPKKYTDDFKKYSLVEKNLLIKKNIQSPKNNIILNQYFIPDIQNFKEFIKKYIDKQIISMIQLNGNYESGKAHIDFVSSYNIYYLNKGKKHVIIVPDANTRYLDLNIGIDNVYVKDDKNTSEGNDWLNKVPSYWSFELEQNELLLFNNSKCIHKFINMTKVTEAFSIRIYHSDSSKLIRNSNILNIKSAFHFSKIITSNNIKRKQNEMD